MARPLSRKARLGLAFAGIALGIGAAVVMNDGHHPVLAFLGMLGAFPGLFAPKALSWRRGRIARPAAAKTDTTTATVRCWVCQHVSAVPQSQPTLVCEQCGAHLERGTAPAESS